MASCVNLLSGVLFVMLAVVLVGGFVQADVRQVIHRHGFQLLFAFRVGCVVVCRRVHACRAQDFWAPNVCCERLGREDAAGPNRRSAGQCSAKAMEQQLDHLLPGLKQILLQCCGSGSIFQLADIQCCARLLQHERMGGKLLSAHEAKRRFDAFLGRGQRARHQQRRWAHVFHDDHGLIIVVALLALMVVLGSSPHLERSVSVGRGQLVVMTGPVPGLGRQEV